MRAGYLDSSGCRWKFAYFDAYLGWLQATFRPGSYRNAPGTTGPQSYAISRCAEWAIQYYIAMCRIGNPVPYRHVQDGQSAPYRYDQNVIHLFHTIYVIRLFYTVHAIGIFHAGLGYIQNALPSRSSLSQIFTFRVFQ